MKYLAIPLVLALAACGPEPTYKTTHVSGESKIVWHPPAKFLPVDGCKQRGVLAVVWSLEYQPDEWAYDGFRLKKDDISIWVANSDYGLEINGFTGLSPACRALLYRKTQQLAENRVSAEVVR